MENISILSYDDKDLNLSNLTLSMPSSVQGGSYFTKIHYAKRPLYMQSPKCISKQGIITIGKKMYIELIISNERDGEFISFLENLEKTCIDMIFEKRHIWLTDDLEKTDIESAFASIIKSYKHGTSHLLKLNINHAKHGLGIGGLQTCFVFDENNNSLTFDDVKSEMSFITIVEFEGIKFTSKSFQFEMNARQILVIDEKPIFNSCLIKPKKKDDLNDDCYHNVNDKRDECHNELNKPEEQDNSEQHVAGCIVIDAAINNRTDEFVKQNNVIENGTENGTENGIQEIKSVEENQECLGELTEFKEEQQIIKDLEIKTYQNENEKMNEAHEENELIEVNLDVPQELDLGSEKIKLQNANDVYYKMYKEAKEKAKSAKKIAVEAYLTAEEIKFTYNLIDNESDSDNSSESESESESEN